MSKARIFLIAGPTASGKSAAAMALAEELDGEIINADAMQVYRDLRIVTARPSHDDEKHVPHHLYGLLDASKNCSAGQWAVLAEQSISEILARGRQAVIAGGTGLYLKALVEGLSPIPDIPEAIRQNAKERRAGLGEEAFYQEVLNKDPAMSRLPPGDTQRLLRAWEVYEATGSPLSYYQGLPRQPVISQPYISSVLLPPRPQLYARCDERAAQMVSAGAIQEVETLLARRIPSNAPILKALGVPEIGGFPEGRIFAR